MIGNAQCGVQPGKFKQSQTWRARRLSALLTFKPVHRELNAAYDFRLRLYVDITSGWTPDPRRGGGATTLTSLSLE
jgi:hypothetical protein